MWFILCDVFRCFNTRQTTVLSLVCIFPDCPPAQKFWDYCRKHLSNDSSFPLFSLSFMLFHTLYSHCRQHEWCVAPFWPIVTVCCCSAIKCFLDGLPDGPQLWKQWKAMCLYCFSSFFPDVTSFWGDLACQKTFSCSIQHMNSFILSLFGSSIIVTVQFYCVVTEW